MRDGIQNPSTTTDLGLEAWERSERRGNYAMMTAILMTAIIGFAAFSVDISLITMAQLQAQSTADAASHAALLGYRINNRSTSAGNTAATWITNYNKVGLGTATLDSVEFGEWNFTNNTFTANGGVGPTNAARAKVSRSGANSVRLLLAPLLGVNTFAVDATAVTSQQNRAVMLVMDLSCSMFTGAWNNPSSAVNVARVANQGFVDYLVTNPLRGDLIGLSMFGQRATTESTVGDPDGNGVATDYPSVAQVPWLRLTEIGLPGNEAIVRAHFNGICDTYTSNQCSYGAWPAAPHPMAGDIGGCTNPGPAMVQAVNELTTRADNTYFKGMIFFSDGVPNCSASGGGSDYMTRAYSASDSAWSNGIYVWTILFHNGSFDPAFMTNLVRGAPVAFASQTPNASQLPTIYQTVAKSLPTALVY